MKNIHKFLPTLVNLVNTLDLIIHEPLYNEKLFKAGHWDYVVYSIPMFLRHISEASTILLNQRPNVKPSFLDVGCGIGTKVKLAESLFKSHGIELSKKYAAVAKKVTKKRKFHTHGRHRDIMSEKKIFRENALTFKNYHKYDVIYFYRPMKEDAMQTQLENKIYNDAKPGALIIPIFKMGKLPNFIHNLKTPSKELYVKLDSSKIQHFNQEIKKIFNS